MSTSWFGVSPAVERHRLGVDGEIRASHAPEIACLGGALTRGLACVGKGVLVCASKTQHVFGTCRATRSFGFDALEDVGGDVDVGDAGEFAPAGDAVDFDDVGLVVFVEEDVDASDVKVAGFGGLECQGA
jgi:hypothetical protein